MAIAQALHSKASVAGLVLVDMGDRVEAREGTRVRAFHTSASRALKLALDRINEDAPPPPVVVEILPVAKGPIKGSVVKSKYKEQYKKNGNYSCGDEMADELRAYLATVTKGRMFIDPKKLRAVADLNGVWKDRYGGLNVGLQRMTIGNCLRVKLANGDQVDIGGAIFQREFKDV